MVVRRIAPLVMLSGLVVAGCGGGGDEETGDKPSASSSSSAPKPTEPTETRASDADVPLYLPLLFRDHFDNNKTYFPTGKGEDHRVAVEQGTLSMFVGAFGPGKLNWVDSPVELHKKMDSLSVDAFVEFTMAYGEGFGGYGIRCYSGKDYYQLYWGKVNDDRHENRASVIRNVGGEFEFVDSGPQPSGAQDGSLRLTAECLRGDDGSVTLRLLEAGKEAVSYVDKNPIGPFTEVSLYGSWQGEQIAPNDVSGPNGAGLTFSWDDVIVRGD